MSDVDSHSGSSSSAASARSYSTPASSPRLHVCDLKELTSSSAGQQDCPIRRCDNVIFDLGDVLFTWSAKTATSVPPKTLRKILRSATWFEYEKAQIEEQDCYAAVGAEFGIDPSEVAAAFQGARDSLQSSPDMLELLHTIKKEPGVRFYAMSNISAPDWEVLKHKGTQQDWDLFERVFTSAEARERKPNLGFFRQVLAQTGVDPSRTAFVDDKLENVLSARSLGLHGIIFTTFEDVAKQLQSLFRDPILAGNGYLHDNAKKMVSMTDSGVLLEENFAQLLLLEQTGDASLVDYIQYPRLCNFFKCELLLPPPRNWY
jgi:FMN phosphatase YigB (HAD superfamily)